MSAANLTQHAASFSCMSAAKGDPELDRSWLPLIVPGLLVGYFMWRLTRKDDPAVDDLVPLTPATEDVIVLNRQCSRNSDILHEREREHITLSHDEGEASASRLFPRRVMSTLRLPLNACSAAAADAIEKCDRRAFPAEFSSRGRPLWATSPCWPTTSGPCVCGRWTWLQGHRRRLSAYCRRVRSSSSSRS